MTMPPSTPEWVTRSPTLRSVHAAVDIDTTFVRLRAVRNVNVFLLALGLVQGLIAGVFIGYLIWG